MPKSAFPLILLIILFVGYAVFSIVGVILAVIVLFIGYFISVRLHPRVRHTGWRGCNGTGEHRGAIFTWTFHRCPGCQGGRMVRRGAGHLGPENVQSEYRRGIEARRKAKQDNRWR
jgi:hypothetical protein